MQCMLPFCLLCIVILQQTVNAASILSFQQNSDNELKRLTAARRLRAPLMGRSITTANNDDMNTIQYELNGTGKNDNESQLINLDKRRYYGIPFLGRRRWMTLKRRGPLFG